jgi:hypothetical protein
MCQGSMTLLCIGPARVNFDARTFECVRCSHVEEILVETDPMQSDVLGWLFGDLRAPTKIV